MIWTWRLSTISISASVGGTCLDTANLSIYGEDLTTALADRTLLPPTMVAGLQLVDAQPDLYFIEMRSDGTPLETYTLDISIVETVVIPENTVDYCRLQFPASLGPLAEGERTDTVYARLYEAGITDITTGTDTNELVRAEIGYGPSVKYMLSTNWVWSPAERICLYVGGWR